MDSVRTASLPLQRDFCKLRHVPECVSSGKKSDIHGTSQKVPGHLGPGPGLRGNRAPERYPGPLLAAVNFGNYVSRSPTPADPEQISGGRTLERLVSPGSTVRAMLLAGVHIRLAVAILLSIALWSGYFWVVRYSHTL